MIVWGRRPYRRSTRRKRTLTGRGKFNYFSRWKEVVLRSQQKGLHLQRGVPVSAILGREKVWFRARRLWGNRNKFECSKKGIRLTRPWKKTRKKFECSKKDVRSQHLIGTELKGECALRGSCSSFAQKWSRSMCDDASALPCPSWEQKCVL